MINMKSTIHAAVLFAAMTTGLTACPAPDDPYREGMAIDVSRPIALGSTVAFLDRGRSEALLIDPSAPRLAPRRVAVGKNVVLAVPHAAHDSLLVLSRGEPGKTGVAPQKPRLDVIPSDPTAAPRVIELGSRYDSLSQSADGRFVIASFSAGGRDADQGLFNPNELAIIDLTANPELPPVTRTVRSFGSVPLGIVFSPVFQGGRLLPDGPRSLAVVLSLGYVTLIDLNNLNRSEITVALTLADDARIIKPAQVVFDALDPTIYVRVEGADDVYTLRLADVPAAARVSNDFFPSLSQVGAGGRPSDMTLFDAGQGSRLLVVAPGTGDATVLDPLSSHATRIPLGFSASTAYLFDGPAPGDPQPRKRAVLMGGGTQMAFLDLSRIEEMRTRNLDVRPIGVTATQVIPLPAQGSLLAISPAGNGQGVSVVHLGRRTASPLLSSTALSNFTLAAGRLWFLIGAGDRVGFLNLANLQPGEVRLDRVARALVPVTAAAAVGTPGTPLMVAVHDDPTGSLTVLDATLPERATARSVEGLFLTDVLEQEAK